MDNQLMNFLTSQGLGNGVLILIALTLYLLILFRKGIVKQLVEECGIATKKDLDEAIYKLRAEQKADIKSIKDNDLQHINNDILNLRKDMDAKMELLRKEMEALRKAVLLLAQKYVDDPERLERIKDLLTI
ncbi:MAG: hypothetical protein MdMp024_0196 [Bacteroidales bacterium]